jgi:DNA-directed RNA polymerase subunit alpha
MRYSVNLNSVPSSPVTAKGVLEDVPEIILNLKRICFKRQIDSVTNERAVITMAGKQVFTAGDINAFLSGFQVLNPEVVICSMEPNVKLVMEITIDKGRGYVPAEENKVAGATQGTIFTDSIFTPIKNVKFFVDNYRVEQKTDYEKLVLEVTTNGSIGPKEALKDAAL